MRFVAGDRWAGAANAQEAEAACPRFTKADAVEANGGPLGNVNCTMASGAMLARLGYGIVTTGSHLRALQPDQEGGTSLADLQVAIKKWGVAFNQGAISPLQLRARGGAAVTVCWGAHQDSRKRGKGKATRFYPAP